MFHECPEDGGRSISFGIEGRTRPRAATVSFRYTAPESPMYRPSLSPPNSPPSLILPPIRMKSGGIGRSMSRISLSDERLASSAPSASQFWPFENERSDMRFGNDSQTSSLYQGLSSADFTLVEEDSEKWCISGNENHTVNASDGADHRNPRGSSFIQANPDHARPDLHSFSASPILMSCLRDIAKTRRCD